MEQKLCRFSTGFEGLRVATTSAFLQTFGSLSWRKQEERNPELQAGTRMDYKLRTMEIESGPGALLGFK